MIKKRLFIYSGLVLCFMSIMAFMLVNRYVKMQSDLSADAIDKFHNMALGAEVAIQNSIVHKLDTLYAMRDAYAVTEQHVNRARFKLLATSILSRSTGIQALEWIPRIPHSERSQYERRAQLDGLKEFMIKEPDGKGNMIMAKERDEYFPVYYVEPGAGNEKALGFNLASNPERESALKKALKTGNLTTSSRIKLVQETGNQYGVLIFLSQTSKEITEPEQINNNLLLGVFRIRDMVDKAFAMGFHPDLNIHIYDTQDKENLSPLVVLSKSKTQYQELSLASLKSQYGHIVSQDILVGDRTWRIIITPATPIAVFADERLAWLIAALVVMLLLIIGMYVISRIRLGRKIKDSSERHRETSLKLHSILDNTIDGIITVDHSGVIQSCNKATQKIFGYTDDEVIGSNISLLIPDFRFEDSAIYSHGQVEGRNPDNGGMDYELEGIVKGGQLIPIRLGISDVTVNNEKLYVGILQDITERRRMEEIKDSFISTVNHELRTPLTSILGGVELLSKLFTEQLPEKARELLEIVDNNTRRITRIVNDILDIQKIEAGEMKFNLKPVDLSSLIRGAISENRIYAEKYKAKPVVAELVDNITVLADADRLFQVMTNLLSNAIKFSPKGSEISVASTVDEKCQIIRVAVTDQGPGIPEKFKEKIFQRFSQADNILTRKASGTGLGLSISKAIIEQLGGVIGVESEEGQGAVFYFELEVHSRTSTTTDDRA